MTFQTIAEQLVDAGKMLYSRGMVPATSGNFSARLADNEIAITVSGKHKGRMSVDDIMRVDLAGKSLAGKKSSAETALHIKIYQRFSEAKAILHAHSTHATVISLSGAHEIVLRNYELLKVFPGIMTHETAISVPIFENNPDLSQLAKEVDDYMINNHAIPAYLIRGHGFYIWGKSIDDALHYAEALEFLLECEIILQGVLKR